jgi:hypothetical protein
VYAAPVDLRRGQAFEEQWSQLSYQRRKLSGRHILNRLRVDADYESVSVSVSNHRD